MLVLKPIILCVITLIVVIMLKNFSPEFVPIAVLSCGTFILIYVMPYITSVLDLAESLGSRAVNISPIIKNTLCGCYIKIKSFSYVTTIKKTKATRKRSLCEICISVKII